MAVTARPMRAGRHRASNWTTAGERGCLASCADERRATAGARTSRGPLLVHDAVPARPAADRLARLDLVRVSTVCEGRKSVSGVYAKICAQNEVAAAPTCAEIGHILAAGHPVGGLLPLVGAVSAVVAGLGTHGGRRGETVV